MKKKIILVNGFSGEVFCVYVGREDYAELIPAKQPGFIVAEEPDWQEEDDEEEITH